MYAPPKKKTDFQLQPKVEPDPINKTRGVGICKPILLRKQEWLFRPGILGCGPPPLSFRFFFGGGENQFWENLPVSYGI